MIVLIDEVLTPDSSRFWPQDQYEPGGAQPSFDKQFVRDYLEADPLEQAAACAVAARRRRRAHARKIPRSLPAADGRDLQWRRARPVERLVLEMLDKGVRYDEGRREFEKVFIARALQRTKGNLASRRAARPPPQHDRPENR